jgi:hypothetical protein
MRLYRSQIPIIAETIIDKLSREGDIEVASLNREEAMMDMRAILEEYARQESRLSTAARDHMELHGITYDQLGKIRRNLADKMNHPTGRDGINWVITQILEDLMRSQYIDEVFAADHEIRRKLKDLFRKILDEEGEVDFEVRGMLKNLKPGTPEYEIEYRRRRTEVLARQGLTD